VAFRIIFRRCLKISLSTVSYPLHFAYVQCLRSDTFDLLGVSLFAYLSPVHTSNNVKATLSNATSGTILSTVSNVASTKSNVASTLLLVWTGPYLPSWLVGRMWRTADGSRARRRRRSATTSSRRRNSVAVGPTSRWTSCPSWSGSSTRPTTRTRLWGKSWVRDSGSARLGYRCAPSSSASSASSSSCGVNIRKVEQVLR